MKLGLRASVTVVGVLGAFAACSGSSTDVAADAAVLEAAVDATQPLDSPADAPPKSDAEASAADADANAGDAEASTVDAGAGDADAHASDADASTHDAAQADASDAGVSDATEPPLGRLAFDQAIDAGAWRVGVLALVDGAVPSFVTGLAGSQAVPSLSPDGKRLFFLQRGASTTDVYVADPDGKNPRFFMPCGDQSAYCGPAQPAANGDIYFLYEDTQTLMEVRVATPSADGGFAVHSVLQQPNACYLSNLAVSPDGTKAAIAVVEGNGCLKRGLYVMPLPLQGLNTPVPAPTNMWGAPGQQLWFNETSDRVYYLGVVPPGIDTGGLYSAKLDGSDSRLELTGGGPASYAFAGGAVAHDSVFYYILPDAGGIVGAPLLDGGPQRPLLPGPSYGELVWAR